MNTHFTRSIHWFICLLCISLNALAEAPSPTLNAIVDAPPLTRKTVKIGGTPAFIEAGRAQGHYERGIEPVGAIELRGAPSLTATDAVSPAPRIRSRPAIAAAKKIINPNKFIFAEAGRAQGHHERGIHALYEDELRGDNLADSRLVYIDADRMEGSIDKAFEAVGDVTLRSGDKLIQARRIKYFQDTEEIVSEGGVRVEHQGRGDVIEGSQLRLNLENTTGQLSQVNYRLQKGLQKEGGSSRGNANLLLFEGEHNYRIRQGSYTTCPAGDDDWVLQADDLAVNTDQKVGTARHVKLEFKKIPIAYIPWMNFSFDNERKSGLLAPVVGYSVRTGAEMTVPFYWNIAPNVDATFSARMMSNRGIMLQNELRYLEKNVSGNLQLEYLPSTMSGVIPGAVASDRDRHYLSFQHEQKFGHGWSGRIDYNNVSDSRYFLDLAYDVRQTSMANLKQEAALSYQRNLWGDGSVNFKAMAQSFQNIRGAAVYQRLPEFTLDITKPNVFGTELDLKSSWASFSHRDPTRITGNRLVLNPSISIPLRREFGHITPKIGIHHTSYDLNSNPQGPLQPDRTIPIFSLDSGAVLERSVALRGERFTQTLEPRAMYVYVPYRDQSHLPNFDSTFTDFSFAQIFRENRFAGSDRINDANRVTLGLTSRFFEESSGKERLSLSIGQQIHFSPQRVTSLNIPTPNSRIDLIAGVTGHFTPQIKTDTTLQFDQSKAEVDVVRSALSFSPQIGKVINIGYRYSRFGPGLNLGADQPLYFLNPLGLHQADISTQWRFSERWQAVGKINYSLKDSRILESLAGIEYNACCWSLRFMFSQMAILPQHTTTAAFLQLELNGLMGIGISPLKALQQRIPGYTDTSPTARNRGGIP